MKAMVIKNPHAWEFYSWQNMTVFGVFLLWTIWIGWAKRRTPLEAMMPRLDRKLVGLPLIETPGAFEVLPLKSNES